LDGYAGDEVLSHSGQALGEALRLGKWSEAARQLGSLKESGIGTGLMLKYAWRSGAVDLFRHGAIRLRRGAEKNMPFLYRIPSEASRKLLRHLKLPVENFQLRPRGIKDHAYIHSIYPFYPYLEAIERSASYHGIDIRFPYLDKRVIEYCISLPASQTMGKNAYGRYQLRRAMEGILPPEVQWRAGKATMEAHLLYCSHEPVCSRYRQSLPSGPLKAYLRKSAFSRMTKNNVPGIRLLWKAAVLSDWLGRLQPQAGT
jgi:asparagine synthase (glutamine-hydrolysing)